VVNFDNYCSRSVKNKETGLDLAVSSVKETPGLLTYSLEFSVIVVSDLSCFKLPQHKETDTVQFMVIIIILVLLT
jgi:hypothetical protein